METCNCPQSGTNNCRECEQNPIRGENILAKDITVKFWKTCKNCGELLISVECDKENEIDLTNNVKLVVCGLAGLYVKSNCSLVCKKCNTVNEFNK